MRLRFILTLIMIIPLVAIMAACLFFIGSLVASAYMQDQYWLLTFYVVAIWGFVSVVYFTEGA